MHIFEWSHRKIAGNALDYISMTFLSELNLTKTKLGIKLVENVGGQVLVKPKDKLEENKGVREGVWICFIGEKN